MSDTNQISRVAVCGAGAMGGGIALLAVTAGAEVAILDVSTSSLDASKARIEAELRRSEAKGRLSTSADEVLSRISWIDDASRLGERDLVIEAIIEDADAKRSLFAALEQVVGPDTIIASNTSSLPIARLAAGLTRPERFIGMHFFNPATVMKLVEVIGGPDTRPEVVDLVESTARDWGKLPVRVADVPGFIVNRVARPYYAEGFRAWQEGIAPELIDHLFRTSAGFRMGPLELSDLIGQDVNFAVARSVYDAYFGLTRFVPQRAQAALVDGGRLGRKTGRGVFDYRAPSDQTPTPRALGEADGPPSMPEVSLGDILLDDVDLLVRVTRGRTAKAECHDLGRPVLLVDWCALGGQSVGVAASDHESGVVGAKRLAARFGVQVHRLPDRPGLLVARTLCQIANSGMDALLENVSDSDGIDAALRYGANYPFGLIAWAKGQGRDRVAGALSEIAHATGQPMYLPSEQWSRQ